MRGRSGYGCSKWRDGCKFVVKDGAFGIIFQPELMRELLFNGRTLEPQAIEEGERKRLGFVKLGKKGALEIDAVEAAQIPDGAEKVGDCPVCRSAVVEGPKGFGCCNWKNGCKFVVWKVIAQREVSLEETRSLLEWGETELLDGFKSKAGKEFSARLVVVGDKVRFKFENG